MIPAWLGRLSSIARKVGNGFLSILEKSGAAILIFMAALMTTEVVGRTLIGWSTGFTYELIGALTGCLGLVVLAPTFRKGDHIRILMLVSKAPPRLQNGLNIAAHVLALAYACLLLRYTTNLALHSLRVREISWTAITFPIYPFKIALWIGAGVFTGLIAWGLYALFSQFRGKE